MRLLEAAASAAGGPAFHGALLTGALFRLSGAVRRDPRIDAWFAAGEASPRHLAQPWFERLRACGPDVRECLHDGHPTACVSDAAFAYVDAFTAHASVGFFHGATLFDSAGVLQGTGKRMRHVKLRANRPVAEDALETLVAAAYKDVQLRLSEWRWIGGS